MRECDFNLAFLGKCSKKPDGTCLFLDNETVPGGIINEEEIKKLYKERGREVLVSALGTLQGRVGEKCKAKDMIVKVLLQLKSEQTGNL